MTKEKILDKHYQSKMHWKSVNRGNVLNAMEAFSNHKLKEYASSKPYVESDLQGCELCERYADIELMHANEDCYICQICKDSMTKNPTN